MKVIGRETQSSDEEGQDEVGEDEGAAHLKSLKVHRAKIWSDTATIIYNIVPTINPSKGNGRSDGPSP